MNKTFYEKLKENAQNLNTNEKVNLLNEYFELAHYYDNRIYENTDYAILEACGRNAENVLSLWHNASKFDIDHDDYYTYNGNSEIIGLNNHDIDGTLNDYIDDIIARKDDFNSYVANNLLKIDDARNNAIDEISENDEINTALYNIFDDDLSNEENILNAREYLRN